MSDAPQLDPYRHLKRLNKVFGVSRRIQKLAQSHIKPESTPQEILEQNEFLANAKISRDKRIGTIDAVHRCIIETVASQFSIQYEDLLEGIVDCEHYIELLQSFVAKSGRKVLLVYYDVFAYPPKGKS